MDNVESAPSREADHLRARGARNPPGEPLTTAERIEFVSRVIWKAGNALSLRLKDGSFVLTQLLKEPYMVFFKAFSDTDTW